MMEGDKDSRRERGEGAAPEEKHKLPHGAKLEGEESRKTTRLGHILTL